LNLSFDIVYDFFLEGSDIDLSDFELVLYNLVQNSGVFEEIEGEPREENESENGPDSEKYSEEDIVPDEFPFVLVKLEVFMFLQNLECSREFFESIIKTLCCLQKFLLGQRIKEEFFLDESHFFYDVFLLRFSI